MPVFAHLSNDSKRQLEGYLLSGNTAFREKRLLEFFKTVDWVAPAQLGDDRVLQKLAPALQRQLKREIQDYHNNKASSRAENAGKREDYKLRVFEYFRLKIPSTDKALLETLRDYELNLTGRDVNWRHYFTLDSFKKIDAFIRASEEERQAWFTQFRKDVDTYKKNYDKIHHAQAHQTGDHAFTFDDWCEMMDDEIPRSGSQSNQRANHRAGQSGQRAGGAHSGAGAGQSVGGKASDHKVLKAHQTLQVPYGASQDAVKKQFRKLTLLYHPDLPTGSEEQMKSIIAAYAELKRFWQACAHAF